MNIPQEAFITMEKLLEESEATEELDKILNRLQLMVEE